MKMRCYNENNNDFKYYGGRNIKICNEWLNDFKVFREWAINNGYKEGLSIDRIDVNGNYEPNNCQWIELSKQARNRRTTHWLDYKGEKIALAEVAERENVNQSSLFQALKRYNTLEEAIRVAKLNKQGMMSTNTSGYRNIYPDGKKWYVRYRRKYLGVYETIEEAIQVRDNAIEEYKKRAE
jgi:hypothetical protein